MGYSASFHKEKKKSSIEKYSKIPVSRKRKLVKDDKEKSSSAKSTQKLSKNSSPKKDETKLDSEYAVCQLAKCGKTKSKSEFFGKKIFCTKSCAASYSASFHKEKKK